MLVFAGICPHPPLVIPNIGKDNLAKVEKTVLALGKLEHELYASQPEVIIIISPHAEMMPDAFLINLHENYQADFEDFGDYQTKMDFKNSPELVAQIKGALEGQLPFSLISNQRLDHGAGVPLYYLTKHLKRIEIVPLSYSFLKNEKHWQLGELLHEVIANSPKRIAVIASGDLSHCLSKGAPASYSPKGQEFDNKLIEIIKKKAYPDLLKLDDAFIEEAAECGLRSFLILFGLIDKYNHTPEILSYEGPFGVGYLVANFKLK